jgi:aminopeptidase N
VTIKVTVPSDLIVASNGILSGIIQSDDKLTYHWKTYYPISTYLVSLAISNYEQFSDWYSYSDFDSMEVVYYVYPEHLNAAKEDFSITVEMMEFFASIFGEYPFIEEKYGMAIFPWSGGMEHQTITSYGSGLVWGTHRYDFINAHELAHQWFGDCITMRHWSHIWLNEGFSSYAEALWFEYINGKEAYHTYVNRWDQIPLNAPLFVTDSLSGSALFSRTVYDKGGWVLHMLRGVLGDSLFFESLKAYVADPDIAYNTAVTEDFQRVCEDVSGMKLDKFFKQWVYGGGRPDYSAKWSISGENPWEITLEITQANSNLFKMPLQVILSSSSFEKTYTVWDSLEIQRFQFMTDEKPDKLEIDPDNWVMKNLNLSFVEGDLNEPPVIFSVSQNYPNPFNPETYIDVLLPQDGTVKFEVYTILGEKVYQESSSLSAGYRTLVWRGETNLGTSVSSGIYLYRVKYGSEVITKKMILVR